eukprot:scaffold5.g631.t1
MSAEGQQHGPASSAAAVAAPREGTASPPGSAVAPVTPPAVPAQAAVTPGGAGGAAAAAAAGAAPAEAPAGAECGAQRAAAAASIWRRASSFMAVAATSPVVQAALCAVEAGDHHPAHEGSGAASLHWTLASMLGLFLKAGYATATEEQLLAALWTLESFGDIWRGPASTVLHGYLQHLHAFCPQARARATRLAEVTSEWPQSFHDMKRGMAAVQMDLLKRLDWRVRLSYEAELLPCHSLLFELAPATRAAVQAWQAGAPGTARQQEALHALLALLSPQEGWAVRMNQLVSGVWAQARRSAAAAAAAATAAQAQQLRSAASAPASPAPAIDAVAAASSISSGASSRDSAASDGGSPSPAKRRRRG